VQLGAGGQQVAGEGCGELAAGRLHGAGRCDRTPGAGWRELR
jgi:hypothetical protein